MLWQIEDAGDTELITGTVQDTLYRAEANERALRSGLTATFSRDPMGITCGVGHFPVGRLLPGNHPCSLMRHQG